MSIYIFYYIALKSYMLTCIIFNFFIRFMNINNMYNYNCYKIFNLRYRGILKRKEKERKKLLLTLQRLKCI